MILLRGKHGQNRNENEKGIASTEHTDFGDMAEIVARDAARNRPRLFACYCLTYDPPHSGSSVSHGNGLQTLLFPTMYQIGYIYGFL